MTDSMGYQFELKLVFPVKLKERDRRRRSKRLQRCVKRELGINIFMMSLKFVTS